MGTDFNGDGRDDILWRNQNGTYRDWYATENGGFIVHSGSLFPEIQSNAFVTGTIDFFNRGIDEILWRNPDGTLHINTRDGYDGILQNEFLAHVPIEWTVVGTGDFNGDGRDDILWQHDNGTITDWLGQEDRTFFGNFASAAYAVDAAWHKVGLGDFNGDGRDDILWRHENGMVTNWLGQEGGTFLGNATAAYWVDQAWRVEGTGDFNGDGRDDILWRYNDGTVTNWLGQEDETFLGNFGNASYAVDRAWRVEGTGDFNGDGRDDILWRYNDGTVTNWLGQEGGTFLGNFANAANWMDTAWRIQLNPSGIGDWDY